MPTVHLSCPGCTFPLRSQRLIAPGERLRCPRCGGAFRAGIDNPPPRPAAPSAVEPGGGRGVLAAWLLFAAFLLLVGGGFAVAVAMNNRAGLQEAAARTAEENQLALAPAAPARDRIAQPVPPPPLVPAPSVPSPVDNPGPDTGRTPPSVEPPKPPPLPPPPQADPQPARPVKPARPKPVQLEKLPAPTPPERKAPAPQLHRLPAQVQKQVDLSIDQGVEYLRRRQRADGSWGDERGKSKRFITGITALAGLTLLECGVPARDPQVRLAATYLRHHMPDLTATYSISLSILFFDRLGEAADAARIRTLALRLIAGQRPSGGWDYFCPTLRGNEELGLLARLYKDRPTTPLDLFTGERLTQPLEGEIGRKEARMEGGIARKGAKLENDLYRPRPSKVPPLELFVAQGGESTGKTAEAKPETPARPEALPPPEAAPEPSPAPTARRPRGATDPVLPGDSRRLSKRALEAAEKLPDSLRRIPALHAADLLSQPPDFHTLRTDNSNTQFAILGLLTAENYDVPMERAMALLDWRFRSSVSETGGWQYQPRHNKEVTPSMTASGLMGLALKHGLLLPNRRDRGRNVAVRDELIQRGFTTLGNLLGESFAEYFYNQKRLDKLDLYCLWTVERVAVLYNVRTLGTLDWYPAGVQLLLPGQRVDGSWGTAGTNCMKEPAVSTSFALLFLKRSNLARNLTNRLNSPADE